MSIPKILKELSEVKVQSISATSATMSNGSISLVLPVPITTGSMVKFDAPCDCTSLTGGLIIEGKTYSIVDAIGNTVVGKSVWKSGSMISVLIDMQDKKAFIQNAAGGSVSGDVISLEGGATAILGEEFGEGPYTIEFTEEDDVVSGGGSNPGTGFSGEDCVTLDGGATIVFEGTLGDGPHTITFTEEDEEIEEITGNPGDFLVIGEDGKVTTKTLTNAEEGTF